MDWASVWTDIVLGFLIAGALAAWVPDTFWRDFFLTEPPDLGEDRGAAGRAAGGDRQLRLLGRQRAAGGGALAGRHHLRRRGLVHLRRPDRAAGAGHLPQVLRLEGDGLHPRHLLRRRWRRPATSSRSSSARSASSRRTGTYRRSPRASSWNYTSVLNIVFLVIAADPGHPLPAHGWPHDAQDDEHAGERGGP